MLPDLVLRGRARGHLDKRAGAACPPGKAGHKFDLGYFAEPTENRVKYILDRCLTVSDRPTATLCAHMCRLVLEGGLSPSQATSSPSGHVE